jgi:glucosyl-3-phosphoglycerate synthase
MPPAARFLPELTRWTDWPMSALLDAKGERRVSVVIPARDEAATIASIAANIRVDLIEHVPLVDELVVIDSDSSDDTAQIAAAHGAKVHSARAIRADLGGYPGKGEALWKSQFITDGDLLVFIDADLTGWGTHFVTGLLGPLLTDSRVQLVKGFYDRVLDDGSGRVAPHGGRVTELVARPLLNLFWPELSHIVQPLAGEWAIRRSAFARLSVPVGYGVELAALLDVFAEYGRGGIAQVDLGERAHTHQSVHDLGVMAAEILAVAKRRSAGGATPEAAQLWQFHRHGDPQWRAREIPMAERPPADGIGKP